MNVEADGAGDGAGGGGGGDAGGAGDKAAPPAGGEKPYYETFTKDALKTSPAIQRYKTAEELAEGYVNLEKRLGVPLERRIDLPADPNDAKGMREVYAKLGMPATPEEYGLTLGDKATDTDKAMLADFTKRAHEAGLPANMAKSMLDWWMEKTAGVETARTEAFAAQAAEGKAALEKEWGAKYGTYTKEIGAALVKYGDPDLVKELDGDKIGNYPNLARMMAKMLDRMAEPGAAGGGSGDADRGERAMTPAQAKAAVTTLEGDPVKGAALRDRSHPQHKAVVEERGRLLAMT